MNYYQPSLNIGDLLIRPKVLGLIDHFGVVIAHDRVLQNTPERGEHVTTVNEFSAGQKITVRSTGANPSSVLARAREILAYPQKYHLINRNCQHTANEVANGEAKSPMLFLAILTMIAGILMCLCMRRR